MSLLGTLVLLRHGQSVANADGLFTGLLDSPLSPQGEREACHAATLLDGAGVVAVGARVFTSELNRAKVTARIVAERLHLGAAQTDWRLNERNYGALTGRTKTDVMREVGETQYLRWRRSVATPPPPMSDTQFQSFTHRAPFTELPTDALTRTESLRDVQVRVGAWYAQHGLPTLLAGQDMLVVAHGNSLRALCSILDQLSTSALEQLNIPTGHPLVYQFDTSQRPHRPGGQYLDEEAAQQAALRLALEGGT